MKNALLLIKKNDSNYFRVTHGSHNFQPSIAEGHTHMNLNLTQILNNSTKSGTMPATFLLSSTRNNCLAKYYKTFCLNYH